MEFELVKKMYDEGKSLNEIAKEFKTNAITVRHLLTKNGVTTLGRKEFLHKRFLDNVKKCKEYIAVNPNKKQKDYAADLNVSMVTLRKYLTVTEG